MKSTSSFNFDLLDYSSASLRYSPILNCDLSHSSSKCLTATMGHQGWGLCRLLRYGDLPRSCSYACAMESFNCNDAKML